MTKKSWFEAIGIGLVTFTLGCSEGVFTAPSSLGIDVNVSGSEVIASTSDSASVSLLPDKTASPSTVEVTAGARVWFTNRSGDHVRLHSYNCSEFNMMGLYDGTSKNTLPFSPAGKTCDYFAWEENWSRKIFQGRVVVK